MSAELRIPLDIAEVEILVTEISGDGRIIIEIEKHIGYGSMRDMRTRDSMSVWTKTGTNTAPSAGSRQADLYTASTRYPLSSSESGSIFKAASSFSRQPPDIPKSPDNLEEMNVHLASPCLTQLHQGLVSSP